MDLGLLLNSLSAAKARQKRLRRTRTHLFEIFRRKIVYFYYIGIRTFVPGEILWFDSFHSSRSIFLFYQHYRPRNPKENHHERRRKI